MFICFILLTDFVKMLAVLQYILLCIVERSYIWVVSPIIPSLTWNPFNSFIVESWLHHIILHLVRLVSASTSRTFPVSIEMMVTHPFN
jgi:hypothetical protein